MGWKPEYTEKNWGVFLEISWDFFFRLLPYHPLQQMKSFWVAVSVYLHSQKGWNETFTVWYDTLTASHSFPVVTEQQRSAKSRDVHGRTHRRVCPHTNLIVHNSFLSYLLGPSIFHSDTSAVVAAQRQWRWIMRLHGTHGIGITFFIWVQKRYKFQGLNYAVNAALFIQRPQK